mmetsp:Transcript_8217/g.23360  ORF Transcript_8217/g.23360 Transcript_8217/m.23360 type:complete len:366 (+) Transcript_8217:191-1288(+)
MQQRHAAVHLRLQGGHRDLHRQHRLFRCGRARLRSRAGPVRFAALAQQQHQWRVSGRLLAAQQTQDGPHGGQSCGQSAQLRVPAGPDQGADSHAGAAPGHVCAADRRGQGARAADAGGRGQKLSHLQHEEPPAGRGAGHHRAVPQRRVAAFGSAREAVARGSGGAERGLPGGHSVDRDAHRQVPRVHPRHGQRTRHRNGGGLRDRPERAGLRRHVECWQSRDASASFRGAQVLPTWQRSTVPGTDEPRSEHAGVGGQGHCVRYRGAGTQIKRRHVWDEGRLRRCQCNTHGLRVCRPGSHDVRPQPDSHPLPRRERNRSRCVASRRHHHVVQRQDGGDQQPRCRGTAGGLGRRGLRFPATQPNTHR